MHNANDNTTEPRRLLAQKQRVLLNALMGTGEMPNGFRSERVQALRVELQRKRALAVASAWGLLARALGPRYAECFIAYAENLKGPAPQDPLADGRMFAHNLRQQRLLPDVGRVQALSFDLKYKLRDRNVSPRRGVVIKLTRLIRPPHVVIGLRVPVVGTKVMLIPLGRKRLSEEGVKY